VENPTSQQELNSGQVIICRLARGRRSSGVQKDKNREYVALLGTGVHVCRQEGCKGGAKTGV
jgi:hypothetical protein